MFDAAPGVYLLIGEGRGMVCASTEKAGKIVGGFILVSVPALMRAWRTCRARPLGIGDFRAWLACHELVARRCHVHRDRDRSPRFGVAELAKLTGTPEKRARASVRRLVEAGLIEWTAEAIGFPEVLKGNLEQPIDAIGGGNGNLAIPRRMLRYLANGAPVAMIATVLGLLLRCLSRRKAGFDAWGRCKASWIARTFGISIPAVKVARRELLALGWIAAEDSDQWAMNRWGRTYRIDLGWQAPTPGDGVGNFSIPGGTDGTGKAERIPPFPPHGKGACQSPFADPSSIPPHPDPGPSSIPPDLHQEPSLPGGSRNQEPAGGATGFSSKGRAKEDQPPTVPTKSVPAGMESGSAIPAPKLADVRIDDLKSTSRLLDLHRQAVARGLVTASEADRLRFIGAAEHALAIATNPAALFAWLVLRGCWRYITGADEDSARRRLRAHDFGMPRVSAQPRPLGLSSSRPVEAGGLSEDARIVKAIREATIRAGIFRDPWPAFSAKYPEWTRGRWDAALAELGLA
jgi:hypothetical protein